MKKWITALFLLSVMTLNGCGQTGPLYMPDDSSSQQSTESQ
ncbi:MAG: LPS translocon maturation chaperone LptM [Vibrio sp.]